MDKKIPFVVMMAAVAAVMVFALLVAPPSANWNVQAQAIPWPRPPYPAVNVNFSASTAQTIVAAPTAGGVCVYGLLLTNGSGSTADTVNVYQDGGTTSVASFYLGANGGAGGFDLRDNPQSPYFITNNATGFVVKSSAAVQVNGVVYAQTCP